MKKAIALFALVLAAIALVACGGDDDDDNGGAATQTTTEATTGGGGGGGGGGETLKLSAPADGSLAFDTDQLSAKAGNITIEFDNPAAISHNVEVESPSAELGVSDTIAEDTTTLELTDVKPGTYEFYCNIPGHKEGGMEGALTVK
jgi:plastocyanin